jgi:hypothetical protein
MVIQGIVIAEILELVLVQANWIAPLQVVKVVLRFCRNFVQSFVFSFHF